MSILGVPESNHEHLLGLTQAFFAFQDPTLNPLGLTRNQVFQSFAEFYSDLISDRRQHGQNYLATVLANAKISDEYFPQLELNSFFVQLSTAGHDTTSYALSGAVLALVDFPDQFSTILRDKSMVAPAVEEVFRWVSPVKHFVRTAKEEMHVRGKKISAGDHLTLFYQSANFDEDVFESPERFEIGRKPNNHLAFGVGGHVCIGQALARMQLKAFIDELVTRLDGIELGGEPEFAQSTQASGLKRLPIRYHFKR
ncbi:cytochrome P450 [Variovorax sp. GB1P17]|uniref:cytochrome P450 n=1 Tax=Variovorax sp. GB1P17 TaxID=3443740 RepID=UPI003F47E0AA